MSAFNLPPGTTLRDLEPRESCYSCSQPIDGTAYQCDHCKEIFCRRCLDFHMDKLTDAATTD